MDDILDYEEKEKSNLDFNIFGLLPVFIALSISLYSLIFNGLFLNVIIFILCCIVCITLAYFKKRIWKYLFVIVLIVSYFGVIQVASFGVGLGIGALNIDLIPTALILLHLLLHFHKSLGNSKSSETNSVIFNLLSKKDDIGLKHSDNNQALVNRFESKYKNKSKVELQQIVDNPSMVKEAKLVAQKLINSFQD